MISIKELRRDRIEKRENKEKVLKVSFQTKIPKCEKM